MEVELNDDEDVSDEREEDKDGAGDGACTAGELFTIMELIRGGHFEFC